MSFQLKTNHIFVILLITTISQSVIAFDDSEFESASLTLSPHVSLDQAHFVKEPDIVSSTQNSVQMRVYPIQSPFDQNVKFYYVIVEYRRKDENISYLNEQSQFQANTTFGHSANFRLPYYAALRIRPSQFLHADSLLFTVGDQEFDSGDQIDPNQYLNPLLVCGYEYRFGVVAELAADTNDTTKDFIKYIPVSRSIILGSSGSCDSHDILMILFVVAVGLLAFALMAVLGILIYTKFTTNESWGSVLRFWSKPSLSSNLFKGGKYGKDRLTLLNHISSSYDDEDDSDDGPINVENFTEIEMECRSNPIRIDRLFSYFCEAIIAHRLKEEFLQIPKGQLRHWKTARMPINRNKHRYNSLMAYDYNRVILKELPNERYGSTSEAETNLDFCNLTQATDYINASYIDGPLGKRRFIATQGPLHNTLGDFWKMIWQTNAAQIVMLTNVQEMGKTKCEKYWPDLRETLNYGQLICTLHEEQVCADYTVRLLRLCLASKQYEIREIIQYHFTAWPDHSIPAYSDAIPMLLHRVRSFPTFREVRSTPKQNGDLPEYSHPVVIHCSAGIGRTGTLMLISNVLDIYETIKNEPEPRVDILQEFCRLRPQRINLIERISQYVFVHRILVEMLARKDLFDFKPDDFVTHYRRVKSESGRTDKSLRIGVQFKCLQKFRNQIDRDSCSVGHFHLKRNNNKEAIPANNARVVLPVLDNDYINALYVNSFKTKNAFIVTEVPLKEYRGQFWLMMNSCEVDTVVLLNNVSLADVYWPTELNIPLTFRELKVELMCEEKNTDFFVKRQFRINGKKLIYQLHYSNWPTVSKRPNSPENLLLMLRWMQQHMQSLSSYPNQCVIQCNNGVTASGVICAAIHLLERLEIEERVNVFLSTKYIRTHRPQFIEDLEQYNFLYDLAELFVRSVE